MKKLAPAIYQFFGFRPLGDFGPFTFYTTRRGDRVFYPRAPPKEPASQLQIHRRNQFRLVARAWNATAQSARAAWENATKRLSLKLTGYNLFTYYQITKDRAAIATIERQSRIQLLP